MMHNQLIIPFSPFTENGEGSSCLQNKGRCFSYPVHDLATSNLMERTSSLCNALELFLFVFHSLDAMNKHKFCLTPYIRARVEQRKKKFGTMQFLCNQISNMDNRKPPIVHHSEAWKHRIPKFSSPATQRHFTIQMLSSQMNCRAHGKTKTGLNHPFTGAKLNSHRHE